MGSDITDGSSDYFLNWMNWTRIEQLVLLDQDVQNISDNTLSDKAEAIWWDPATQIWP